MFGTPATSPWGDTWILLNLPAFTVPLTWAALAASRRLPMGLRGGLALLAVGTTLSNGRDLLSVASGGLPLSEPWWALQAGWLVIGLVLAGLYGGKGRIGAVGLALAAACFALQAWVPGVILLGSATAFAGPPSQARDEPTESLPLNVSTRSGTPGKCARSSAHFGGTVLLTVETFRLSMRGQVALLGLLATIAVRLHAPLQAAAIVGGFLPGWSMDGVTIATAWVIGGAELVGWGAFLWFALRSADVRLPSGRPARAARG